MTWLAGDNDATNEALLLHEVAHQMRKCFDRRAQHLKLTRSQWHALAILRRNPGMRQAQLADKMEVEPITLARLLDRMTKAGWVERRQDPEDRRANQVYLTEKVKGIVQEMRAISLTLRRDALSGFTEQEHAALVKYLARIKANTIAILRVETEAGE